MTSSARVAECGCAPVEAMFSTDVGGWFMAFDNQRAAGFEPLAQRGLSPQCGYSSTHHGTTWSQDEQWRKLERVVEVARRVWG